MDYVPISPDVKVELPRTQTGKEPASMCASWEAYLSHASSPLHVVSVDVKSNKQHFLLLLLLLLLPPSLSLSLSLSQKT